MIGIIAAVTTNGVIGIDGKIPFDYPEDMIHFRKTTLNSTVIMGRKTFEGIGKPLPKRENIVITTQNLDVAGITTFKSIGEAISQNKNKDIWLIGGAKIYELGMFYANKIILTITPDYEPSDKAIRFPWINPSLFKVKHLTNLELSEASKIKNGGISYLSVYEYTRI